MHKAYSFLILRVDYLHQKSAPFWKFYSNVHLNTSVMALKVFKHVVCPTSNTVDVSALLWNGWIKSQPVLDRLELAIIPMK